jgi:methyl-accepting chemotaxis protein
VARVNQGTAIATDTAASLDRIVTNAGEVAVLINNISESADQQAGAIAQISLGFQAISEVVQENASTSEESAAAAQQLSSQAEMLKELVGFFKV